MAQTDDFVVEVLVFSLDRGTAARCLRAASIIVACLVSATCSDQSPVTPRKLAPGHSLLSIAPSYERAAAGGPTLDIQSFKAFLVGPTGDTTFAQGKFEGDSAIIEFDVQFPGTSTQYTLDVTEFDSHGVQQFHVSQPITLKPGENPVIKPQLTYSAPDAALAAVHVSPATVTLNAGGSSTLGVTGTLSNGSAISPLNVGWSSRDASVATVDASGVVHAGVLQKSTYIVATSFTGKSDSARVSVHGAVDHVVTAPAALSVARGVATGVTAELRDVGGNLIDDRSATFTSSDPAVATVSSLGVVTGVAIGSATITATAEGKSSTIPVRVVSPVDHIEFSTPALTFRSLGETQSVSARLVAVAGASVDGIPVSLASSNSSVASVAPNGVVTAVANGSATLSASADGVQATVSITVQQVAVSVTVAPSIAGVTALGDVRQFSAVALDALNHPVVAPVVWATSDASLAAIDAGGNATGKGRGDVTITATAGTVTGSARFTIAQVPAGVVVTADRSPIQVGTTTNLTTRVVDRNGFAIPGAPATLASLAPGILSISGNRGTGVSPGQATVTATAGGFTGATVVSVVAIPGTRTASGALALNVDAVEKLPHGTQQFAVVDTSATGPFTWTVNGLEGGNATFGTITSTGFYTAPAAVPTPATFDVCASQATPPRTGCAHVTINPVPTSGADVIVFNDLNIFDGGDGDSNNQMLFRNLVNFTGTAPRAAKTGVMFYFGHASNGVFGYSTMRSVIQQAGYTIDDIASDVIGPIAAKYKVVFLWLPRTTLSNSEINNLKAFSAEGGRIVFVGEWDGYYGSGIGVENAFFGAMGAQMTNSGGAFDCGFVIEPGSRLRPHQVTTGLTQLTIACASEILPGPNDYPFLYDQSGTRVLAAAAKVDVTPLPVTSSIRASSPSQSKRPTSLPRPASATSVHRDPNDPAGRPIP